MSLTTYALYLAAVAVLVLSPGPTMLMCMTTALNDGRSSGLAAAVGSISAALGVMTLSALGLGALLAASELAFTVVKVIGALYLIWLGIKTFRGNAEAIKIKRTTTPTGACAHTMPEASWLVPVIQRPFYSSPRSSRNSWTQSNRWLPNIPSSPSPSSHVSSAC
jgi:threonine/homoserine/homoserine lactone efflux protein